MVYETHKIIYTGSFLPDSTKVKFEFLTAEDNHPFISGEAVLGKNHAISSIGAVNSRMPSSKQVFYVKILANGMSELIKLKENDKVLKPEIPG